MLKSSIVRLVVWSVRRPLHVIVLSLVPLLGRNIRFTQLMPQLGKPSLALEIQEELESLMLRKPDLPRARILKWCPSRS